MGAGQKKGFTLSFKTKLAAAAIGALSIGGLALAASPANATTFQCIFSNGCGAISGFNVPGDPVSVDAKYQNFTEMAIGFPNNPGDSATNLSLVAHTSPGHIAHHRVRGTVFYTIVGAKDGSWSNQCLTAQGSGMLRFATCTLGRDSGQRFYAYLNGTGTSHPDVVANAPGEYAFRNLATGDFMEDASNSNPAVHQSDIADAMLPTGRQLDVNGTSPMAHNELWTWHA